MGQQVARSNDCWLLIQNEDATVQRRLNANMQISSPGGALPMSCGPSLRKADREGTEQTTPGRLP